jgi:periplasmic protein TonB
VGIGNDPGAKLMVRVAHRSYTRQSRTGWFLLLSLLLHLLVVVALNLPWRTWEELRPERKEPKQNPIRVSFVRPENTEEPEEPEVFAETSSRAQTPQGPTAEVTKDTETALPEAPQAPAATAPPEAPQVPAEPSLPSKAQVPEEPQPQVEAQAREEPEPQVSPPPLPITPKPVPEEPQSQVSPPPLPVAPKPAPEAAAKRPASPPRRQETAKTTTQSPPKREPKPLEPPEPKRMAKLPEPAERTPPLPPQDPTPPARPAVESPAQPEQRLLPRLGRIPLLSGEDLEKYAQVRSSDQHNASSGAVSLDSKELKYLSYFAHIKRRIERVWTYPSDAIANGLQGQLHLKFVLRSDGHLKTVELLRSSGSKVLDKEAWDAVVNAGPFGPFPPTIPDDELHITARFTYVLDEDVQRIRMR